MNNLSRISRLLALAALTGFATLNPLLTTGFAQGSLTPPAGAPAPVMKTLDQVEARRPLIAGTPGVAFNNGIYFISQPGSYYLTGNLTCTNAADDFINISASYVTLDLNGFSLIGTNGLLQSAISTMGFGCRIHNGHIVGGSAQTNGVFALAGFYSAVKTVAPGGAGPAVIITDLTVRGTRHRGISANLQSIVERCIVETTGSEGIRAGTVQNCRATSTLESAIAAVTVNNSVGQCVGAGAGRDGIEGASLDAAVVQNSVGVSVDGAGITASTAINCHGKSTSGIGLSAGTATNCRGDSTSGNGLSANTATNCRGNSTTGTGASVTLATNCRGESNSGIGLYGICAMNSFGISFSGSAGISVTGTANSCIGSRVGGTAIDADIAIACTALNGNITSPQKFLGTP